MRRLASLLTPLLSSALLSGCVLTESIEDFENDGSVLSVFVAHHQTLEDGVIPPRDGPPRFVTDEGWSVVLGDAYITTVGATMHGCSGARTVDVDMYWGHVSEDIDNLIDGQTLAIGGVPLESGDWCGITVRYDRFQASGIEDETIPENDAALDTTVYMYGLATKDGVERPFEVTIKEPLNVLINLATIEDGGPLLVTDGNNPALTLAKVYDRFFDGIDFGTISDEELHDIVLDGLRKHTQIVLGTDVEAGGAGGV